MLRFSQSRSLQFLRRFGRRIVLPNIC
jgi:hypothetical protein